MTDFIQVVKNVFNNPVNVLVEELIGSIILFAFAGVCAMIMLFG